MTLKLDVTPKFVKTRHINALKRKVKIELEKLVKDGVLKSVISVNRQHQLFLSDGLVCVCGNFKVTLNPVLEVDQYPRIEDIFAALSGGTEFSKVD